MFFSIPGFRLINWRILAGAEGFEPPKAVLETAGLPLAYAPSPAKSVYQFTLEPEPVVSELFGFPVRVMFPAVRAELFHLKTASGRLLVFCARVVPVFAFAALERNDFSCHCLSLLNL
jgi:hypothetical protein